MAADAGRVRPRGGPAIGTVSPRLVVSSLATPAIALFAVFALVPLVLVVVLGFTDYSSARGTFAWAGASNWVRLVGDSLVRQGVLLTVLVVVLCWIVQTGLGLVIGVFLAGRQRYRIVLSVLFFLPIVFSPVAVAIGWQNLFAPYFGGVALTVHQLGLSFPVNWLATPGQAIYVVIAVICWHSIPFQSILFLAGARQIPRELYDASTIDGAGRYRTFFHITVPQLRYTLVTSSILVLVGSLLYFEMFLVMTNGGPAGTTTVLPLAMYIRGFVASQEGYGSAIATVLAVLGLLLSLAIVRLSGFGSMQSQQEGV